MIDQVLKDVNSVTDTDSLSTKNMMSFHEKPEDHWSCIAHLSAEDMLKSVVIEEKKFKNIESE